MESGCIYGCCKEQQGNRSAKICVKPDTKSELRRKYFILAYMQRFGSKKTEALLFFCFTLKEFEHE
jgi:hypothetical protein